MDLNIYKELFTEAIKDKEVFPYEYISDIEECNKSIITFTVKDGVDLLLEQKRKINAFELASKCKDWAFNNMILVQVNRGISVSGYGEYFVTMKSIHRNYQYDFSKYFDTEYEAVFDGCKRISDKLSVK